MKKIFLLSVLLTSACAWNHFDEKVEKVDNKDRSGNSPDIYRITTKEREPGVYKIVKDKDICSGRYTIENKEAKIQEEDGPIFYDIYTIKCLPKLLAPNKPIEN